MPKPAAAPLCKTSAPRAAWESRLPSLCFALGLCLSSALVPLGKSFSSPRFSYQYNGQSRSQLRGWQKGFAEIIQGKSLVRCWACRGCPINASRHHPSQAVLWFLWALGGMGGRRWLSQKGREEHLKRIKPKDPKRQAAWEVEECPVSTPGPFHSLLASE